MLKVEFRFFLVDFVPFLNFRIGLGHVAATIKKLRDWLPVLIYFFSQFKSLFKKTCCWQPSTGQHPFLLVVLRQRCCKLLSTLCSIFHPHTYNKSTLSGPVPSTRIFIIVQIA